VQLRYAPGDLNCDGDVDPFDIDPFVLALTDPAGYASGLSGCNGQNADANDDGLVNPGTSIRSSICSGDASDDVRSGMSGGPQS